MSAGSRTASLAGVYSEQFYVIINISVFVHHWLLVTPCSVNNRCSELPNLVTDSAFGQVDSSSDPSVEPTWQKDLDAGSENAL